MKKARWSLDEIEWVCNEYPIHGSAIAADLGRSRKAIKHVAARLGIKCGNIKKNGCPIWSRKELEFLDYHRHWPARYVAKELNRSTSAVKNKRTEFGWKRISIPRTNKGKLAKWRNQVLARDEYKCRNCGEENQELLQAHHVCYRNTNPDLAYDIDNGQALCIGCHYEEHKGKEGATFLYWQMTHKPSPKQK